jgi:hypothetical protein
MTTNMNWRRSFIYKDDDNKTKVYSYKYIMELDILQNNESEYTLVTKKLNEKNEPVIDQDKLRVKVIMILYADETENRNKPVYYITNNRFIGYAAALERMAKDEAYTRKLTKNEQGFSKVLLIVIITIICGIILGSLLFFIK